MTTICLAGVKAAVAAGRLHTSITRLRCACIYKSQISHSKSARRRPNSLRSAPIADHRFHIASKTRSTHLRSHLKFQLDATSV